MSLTLNQRTWVVPKDWQAPALGIMGISLSIALIAIGGMSLHLQHIGSTSWLTRIKLEGAIAMTATGGVGVFVGGAILIARCCSLAVTNNPQSTKALVDASIDHVQMPAKLDNNKINEVQEEEDRPKMEISSLKDNIGVEEEVNDHQDLVILEEHQNAKTYFQDKERQGQNVALEKFERYISLIQSNQENLDREFFVPQRRKCRCGTMDGGHKKILIERLIFVTEEEIVEKHQMKYLSKSPFVRDLDQEVDDDDYKELYCTFNEKAWQESFEQLEQRLYAIGVDANNKHIILQQTSSACVPSCVGMLILDHGGKPDYHALANTYMAKEKDACRWMEKAGFAPKLTNFSPSQDTNEEITQLLIRCLDEDGPGILSITHPVIAGHVIILDEIFLKNNTATIRDSFHGWMVTIKLDTLLSWFKYGEYFLQITGPLSNSNERA